MENNNTKSVIVTKVYTKEGNPIIFDERPEGDQKDITKEYSISHPNEVLKLCVTAEEIEPLLAKLNFGDNKGISVTPCTIGKFYDITKYAEFISSKEVSEDTLDTRGYILADPSNPDMIKWVPEEDINSHLTEICTPATQIRQVLVKEMTRVQRVPSCGIELNTEIGTSLLNEPCQLLVPEPLVIPDIN
jgi:hypothetical protein